MQFGFREYEIAQPVSSGDSQGRAVSVSLYEIEYQSAYLKSVEALAAPDFCVGQPDGMYTMKTEWNRILIEVQSLLKKWRSQGKKIWFRGHSCHNWQVKSSLHRHIEFLIEQAGVKNRFDSGGKRNFLYEEYKTLYREFMADAWPLLRQDERSEWGVIFSMQHHGFPTRLVDWTESFACAVYFAQWQRNPSEDAAIYLLIPEMLNSLSINREALVALHADSLDSQDVSRAYHPKYQASTRDLQPIAVVPYFTNPRMISQRSAFILSGDNFDPLEHIFGGKLIEKGYLKKIVLPSEINNETNKFLEVAGASHYGYFPDFEGLLRQFNEKRKSTIEYAKKLGQPQSADKASETKRDVHKKLINSLVGRGCW